MVTNNNKPQIAMVKCELSPKKLKVLETSCIIKRARTSPPILPKPPYGFTYPAFAELKREIIIVEAIPHNKPDKA